MDSRHEVFVNELGTDDVLLGRGTGSNENSGNIRFRRVLRDVMQKEYYDEVERSKKWSPASITHKTMDPETKERIARRVVDVIGGRKGRFVQKLSKNEAKQVRRKSPEFASLPETIELYRVVQEDEAVRKARAAIRFQLKKQERKAQSVDSGMTESGSLTDSSPSTEPSEAVGEETIRPSSTSPRRHLTARSVGMRVSVSGTIDRPLEPEVLLPSTGGRKVSAVAPPPPPLPRKSPTAASRITTGSTQQEPPSALAAQQAQANLLALLGGGASPPTLNSSLLALLPHIFGHGLRLSPQVVASAPSSSLVLADSIQRELLARALVSQQLLTPATSPFLQPRAPISQDVLQATYRALLAPTGGEPQQENQRQRDSSMTPESASASAHYSALAAQARLMDILSRGRTSTLATDSTPAVSLTNASSPMHIQGSSPTSMAEEAQARLLDILAQGRTSAGAAPAATATPVVPSANASSPMHIQGSSPTRMAEDASKHHAGVAALMSAISAVPRLAAKRDADDSNSRPGDSEAAESATTALNDEKTSSPPQRPEEQSAHS